MIAAETAPVAGWRAKVAPIGLFLPFALAFGLVGLGYQASGQLPWDYTWSAPWRILREVVERSWLPTLLLAAYALGRARATGWRALGRELDFTKLLAGSKTRAIGVVTLVVAAPIVDRLIFPQHHALDALCIFAGASLALLNPHPRDELVRFVGGLALVALGFSLVSYAFTAIKAALFLSGERSDELLMRIESAIFQGLPHRWAAELAAANPRLLALLDHVYFDFFDHMLVTSLLLVGLRLARERTEYLCALAFCYLLGGPLYGLLPGVGPRWADAQAFAFLDAHTLTANGVAGWLWNNTARVVNGKATELETFGYIASMPSLHMAQEFVMLWYARHSRIALVVSVVFTALTWLSTLALGWHYAIDGLAGLALAAVAVVVCRRWRDVLFPAILTGRDEPFEPSRRP